MITASPYKTTPYPSAAAAFTRLPIPSLRGRVVEVGGDEHRVGGAASVPNWRWAGKLHAVPT